MYKVLRCATDLTRGEKQHAPSTGGTTFLDRTTTLDPDPNSRVSSLTHWICHENVAFDPNKALDTATRHCLHRHNLRMCRYMVATSDHRLCGASSTEASSSVEHSLPTWKHSPKQVRQTRSKSSQAQSVLLFLLRFHRHRCQTTAGEAQHRNGIDKREQYPPTRDHVLFRQVPSLRPCCSGQPSQTKSATITSGISFKSAVSIRTLLCTVEGTGQVWEGTFAIHLPKVHESKRRSRSRLDQQANASRPHAPLFRHDAPEQTARQHPHP